MSDATQDDPHDPLSVLCPNCGAIVPPPNERALLVGYHDCPSSKEGIPRAALDPHLNSETAAPMERDWFATVMVVFEIAVGLAAAAGVYAAIHSD